MTLKNEDQKEEKFIKLKERMHLIKRNNDKVI